MSNGIAKYIYEMRQSTHKEVWETYSLLPQSEYQEKSRNNSAVDPNTGLNIEMPSLARDDSDHSGFTIRSIPLRDIAKDNKKKIGLVALTILIFYEVCGGPFGIEDTVRAGGPFYALIGFSLMLVWSVPEALITAELSTAMPEASGAVAWVDCAFGPFWAFQKGWLSLLSGVADNALYPVLFIDCFIGYMDDDDDPSVLSNENGISGTWRWVLILFMTLALTYLNYRGMDVVGRVAIGICIFSLIPFVVFCVVGAFKVKPEKWFLGPKGGFKNVNWRLLLNTFFWNINYWESAAAFAGEVENPEKNYPWGMGYAIILVFCTLFLPVLIATGASEQPYENWTDGHFLQLSKEIVGPWLGFWMMLASALTNIGMFEAEMCSDSWQIAGMADRGIIPSVFGHRSKYDTPTYGILFSTLGVICLSSMSFNEVVDMLNLLYCFGQAIEFFAFIYLRWDKPHMERPFRIPVNFIGACALLTVPVCFLVIILYFSSILSLVLAIVITLIGVGFYFFLEFTRTKNWFHFNPQQHLDVPEISTDRSYSVDGETRPLGVSPRFYWSLHKNPEIIPESKDTTKNDKI